MKSLLIILLFLTGIKVNAQPKDPYLWNLEQTSQDYSIKIDTKSFEKEEKEQPFKAEVFNSKNIIHFFFGLQYDEFEEDPGLFVRNLTPSAHLNWQQRFSLNWGYELEGQVTKNNFIAKQTLVFGTDYGKRREFFGLAQLGEKVALTKQENSGYFFLNYGAGWVERWGRGFRTDTRVYLSNLKYNLWGWEFKALRKIKQAEVGIYLGVEQYNPLKMDYERQGQTSSRAGIMFAY